MRRPKRKPVLADYAEIVDILCDNPHALPFRPTIRLLLGVIWRVLPQEPDKRQWPLEADPSAIMKRYSSLLDEARDLSTAAAPISRRTAEVIEDAALLLTVLSYRADARARQLRASGVARTGSRKPERETKIINAIEEWQRAGRGLDPFFLQHGADTCADPEKPPVWGPQREPLKAEALRGVWRRYQKRLAKPEQ